MFRGGNADELNHSQSIGRNLSTAVVADLALPGSGNDQNLGDIVHAFHLGNKEFAWAWLIAHAR
jgi:hypothetical protein